MHDQQSLFKSLAEVKHKVSTCYAQAESYYLKSFPRPEVLLNLRGRSAGVAELQANRLRFNQVLLDENYHVFLAEVVPHEVAHLLAWQLYGRGIRPHGKEWQGIMRQVFNLTPATTHCFDVRRSARQDFVYLCACPDKKHHLSIRRHNRIRQGQRYVCRQCKSFLSFYYQEESVTKV